MTVAMVRPFDDLPRTPAAHFALLFHGAIFLVLRELHRHADSDDRSLDQTLERLPFLAGYFAAIREHLPEDITWDEAEGWWHDRLSEWEAGAEAHLPLRALLEDGILDRSGRLALLVVGLVEEDARFGAVLAELQAPLAARRASLGLVRRLIADGEGDAGSDPWLSCRPLLASGLIEVLDPDAPRSEWLCGIPAPIWDALRGVIDPRPLPGCRHFERTQLRSKGELILPDETMARLERLPDLLRGGAAKTVVLRAGYGADVAEVAGALALALGRGLMIADGAAIVADPARARRLGPLCTLARALLLLTCEPGPGETVSVTPLPGYAGPVAVALGPDGGLGGDLARRAVTLSLPPPPAGLRRRHWQRALGDRLGSDLAPAAERFHIAGGLIREVAEIARAEAALSSRDDIRLIDVQAAARALNRETLDALASRLEPRGSWVDLIGAESTIVKLHELERRCRHRERLLEHLGAGFATGTSRGVRALFTGPSGTGKTLAAKILAAELAMDLYRVDLAAVINKYIGETEKNLARILARAESLDVVLLLDEGDTLLGSRTEVRSANDRYANLETNYLLQRLETYDGIILVTTNLGENIDPAFRRRMDVVVPFFAPKAEERWAILLHHLPDGHAVPPDFVDLAALRCELTGGQIRNAVLHAALLALDEDHALDAGHLEQGLRGEHRKAGAVFPLGTRLSAGRDGGTDAFLAALARH